MWESYEVAYVSYLADKVASATVNLSSMLFATLSVIDKDGAICNHEEEEPGSDLDVCHRDDAIYIHTTIFASNEETISGKVGPG